LRSFTRETTPAIEFALAIPVDVGTICGVYNYEAKDVRGVFGRVADDSWQYGFYNDKMDDISRQCPG
jgi:hypothetical protein